MLFFLFSFCYKLVRYKFAWGVIKPRLYVTWLTFFVSAKVVFSNIDNHLVGWEAEYYWHDILMVFRVSCEKQSHGDKFLGHTAVEYEARWKVPDLTT